MVHAQGGGDVQELPLASAHEVLSTQSGYLSNLDCRSIGGAVVSMGGGRRRVDDTIDHSVGIRVHARIGDRIERGQPIFTAYFDNASESNYVVNLQSAFTVEPDSVASRDLILRRMTRSDLD